MPVRGNYDPTVRTDRDLTYFTYRRNMGRRDCRVPRSSILESPPPESAKSLYPHPETPPNARSGSGPNARQRDSIR